MPNSADQKTYGLFSTTINRKLVRKLEDEGARVFQFPPVETEKIKLDETSINYLQNLTKFDWIILPDVLAADYFLQALEECAIDFFELDKLNVCAFGEAVADRLRFVQIHTDLNPNFVETDVIFTTILNYISPKGLENLRFLIPKESFSEMEIFAKLAENKAVVTELPVYQALISAGKELSKLKVLLTGGAIDEFVFSSPTDLISLKYLFAENSITEILSETKVSATDEVIFQSLKEHGQKPKFYFVKNEI